jgi:alpha-tubulin suppressor-like RCC1 family protein
MSDIKEWKVLYKLNPQFVNNIEFLCVLGQIRNEVLIVTKNDKFYSFGNNSNGCLGLGHKYPIEEPFVVNELCDQQIIQISYVFEHVMALTRK